MKAVIPAAGIGTRLRPLTYSLPKILLNVAGKPLISYLVDDLLRLREIKKIIIIIGYLGHKVKEFVAKTYPNEGERIVLVEQKETLGLGHAVYQTRQYLANEPLLIVLGDTIFQFDFKNFIASDYSSIGVKDVADPSRYGIIEADGGFITRMIEKPSGPEITQSRKAIGGVYFIKDSSKLINSLDNIISADVKTKNEYQLTDGLQDMLSRGEKFVTSEITNWFDCGNPEALLFTNEYMLTINGYDIDTSGYSNTSVNMPSYIGKNCKIENSIIGPFATIADGVSIRNSKIENSVIHDNAKIDDSVLEGSIIGPGVKVKGSYKNLYIAEK